MAPDCDDACLTALSADLAAAIAWGVGADRRWSELSTKFVRMDEAGADDEPLSPRPPSDGPTRRIVLTDVAGNPIPGTLRWFDPETQALVRLRVEGPVDVPRDVPVRAEAWMHAWERGGRLIARVAPRGTPVPASLEGGWASAEGLVDAVGGEVRWADGRTDRFERVWSNGAWEHEAECAWILTAEDAALRVCGADAWLRLTRR